MEVLGVEPRSGEVALSGLLAVDAGHPHEKELSTTNCGRSTDQRKGWRGGRERKNERGLSPRLASAERNERTKRTLSSPPPSLPVLCNWSATSSSFHFSADGCDELVSRVVLVVPPRPPTAVTKANVSQARARIYLRAGAGGACNFVQPACLLAFFAFFFNGKGKYGPAPFRPILK